MTTIRVSDNTKAKLKKIANGRVMDKFMQMLIGVYRDRQKHQKIHEIDYECIRNIIREELEKVRR